MRTRKQELISDELKPLVSQLIKENREKYNTESTTGSGGACG